MLCAIDWRLQKGLTGEQGCSPELQTDQFFAGEFEPGFAPCPARRVSSEGTGSEGPEISSLLLGPACSQARVC